jgi:putative FmdB family regulatory protein
MPVFEFHCPSCGQGFDELVPSADDLSAVACPGCGNKRVERRISVFSAHSSASPPGCPMTSAECDQCPAQQGACGLR